MNAQSYVESKLEKIGLASYRDRVFGDLAIAGIHRNTRITVEASSAIDSLLAKLSARLGVVADNKKSTKRTADIKLSDPEKVKQSVKNTEMLLQQIDPATGDRLSKVKLLGGVYALHNASTRVVYPIPASKNLPEYV